MNFVEDGPTFPGRLELRWEDVVNSDLHKKYLSLSLASDSLKMAKCYQSSDTVDWTPTHSKWNTDEMTSK